MSLYFKISWLWNCHYCGILIYESNGFGSLSSSDQKKKKKKFLVDFSLLRIQWTVVVFNLRFLVDMKITSVFSCDFSSFMCGLHFAYMKRNQSLVFSIQQKKSRVFYFSRLPAAHEDRHEHCFWLDIKISLSLLSFH